MKQNKVTIIIGLGFALTSPLFAIGNAAPVPRSQFATPIPAASPCVAPQGGGEHVLVIDTRKQPARDHYVRKSQHNQKIHQPDRSGGANSRLFVTQQAERIDRQAYNWANYLANADTDSIHMLIKKVQTLQCKRYRLQLLAVLHKKLAQREGGVAGLNKNHRKKVNRLFGSRGVQNPEKLAHGVWCPEFEDDFGAEHDAMMDRFEEEEKRAGLKDDLLDLRENYLLSLEDPDMLCVWQKLTTKDADWADWISQNQEVADLFNQFVQAYDNGFDFSAYDIDLLYELVDLFQWIHENIVPSDEEFKACHPRLAAAIDGMSNSGSDEEEVDEEEESDSDGKSGSEDDSDGVSLPKNWF